jgi:hypothetical protein
MKIGSVEFGTMPLIGTSQKTAILPLSASNLVFMGQAKNS